MSESITDAPEAAAVLILHKDGSVEMRAAVEQQDVDAGQKVGLPTLAAAELLFRLRKPGAVEDLARTFLMRRSSPPIR